MISFIIRLVGPDFGAVGGSSQLRAIVGAADLRASHRCSDSRHLRGDMGHRVGARQLADRKQGQDGTAPGLVDTLTCPMAWLPVGVCSLRR